MKDRLRTIWRRTLDAGMSVRPVRENACRLARAGYVPKKLWNRLPVVEDVFEVALPSGRTFRYRNSTGDAIGQALYWRGINGWERATIHAFMVLAERARHFLDIGANTGAYTLIACAVNPDVRVVAYEPVPRVYERLCDNLWLNHLGDRCQAKQLAVSDCVGLTQLHVPLTAMPSSASLNRYGFRNMRGELIDVSLTTVDHDIASENPVDLVKIDVEGFEDCALMGMERILSRDRPIIICECNPDGPYAEVEGILEAAGYEFFHIRGTGCQPMPRIKPDSLQRYRNFVCVHRGDRAAVERIGRIGPLGHLRR